MLVSTHPSPGWSSAWVPLAPLAVRWRTQWAGAALRPGALAPRLPRTSAGSPAAVAAAWCSHLHPCWATLALQPPLSGVRGVSGWLEAALGKRHRRARTAFRADLRGLNSVLSGVRVGAVDMAWGRVGAQVALPPVGAAGPGLGGQVALRLANRSSADRRQRWHRPQARAGKRPGDARFATPSR